MARGERCVKNLDKILTQDLPKSEIELRASSRVIGPSNEAKEEEGRRTDKFSRRSSWTLRSNSSAEKRVEKKSTQERQIPSMSVATLPSVPRMAAIHCSVLRFFSSLQKYREDISPSSPHCTRARTRAPLAFKRSKSSIRANTFS